MILIVSFEVCVLTFESEADFVFGTLCFVLSNMTRTMEADREPRAKN